MKQYFLDHHEFFTRDVDNILELYKPGSSKITKNLSSLICLDSKFLDNFEFNIDLVYSYNYENSSVLLTEIEIIGSPSDSKWIPLVNGGFGKIEYAEIEFSIVHHQSEEV